MVSKLFFYLILIPVSRLPFWFLYGISDVLYLFIYKIFGYRTKVVRSNLENAFPEKTAKERKKIEAEFYKHLCDLVVESIKALTISQKMVKKRMADRNVEVANRYKKENKQMIVVCGHYGNWELLAITLGMSLSYNSIGLYTPLKDQFINKKINESRSKYGLTMVSTQDIKQIMFKLKSNLHALVFASDQSPKKSQKAYWMNFLNQETGVQFGTEKIAKKVNAAVVFANAYKVKRGYYEVEYELICENAKDTADGFITQGHTKRLEKIIREQPAYWLWSHKRWKHKRPADAILNKTL